MIRNILVLSCPKNKELTKRSVEFDANFGTAHSNFGAKPIAISIASALSELIECRSLTAAEV